MDDGTADSLMIKSDIEDTPSTMDDLRPEATSDDAESH